ncbi:hypothetical protein [Xenorhabdus sp. KK7.4]|uniref:hypothetical protein n=1 Tax=Xenorhabdus sp. KK7.4 TaxID=1851572 RepID=UPI000C064992|nr:hypothetical protein [Xenorhabdus sp. KK7.4]PHM49102.1 hypothetical protein Xekk_04356 [Xenorhabdus sp. KK7.4]
MKYDPRLRTFVDNDYRYEENLNFKKQIEDVRHKNIEDELERQLKENNENIAILTKEEAIEYVKTLTNPDYYNSWKKTVKTFYSYADTASSFAGNMYDSIGVARIANDLRSFGVRAREYVGANGRRYIVLSGYPGVRNYLNATRYLANNPQIVTFGVGTLGVANGIAEGRRFGIIFSGSYRLIELMFKEGYGLTDLFVNLTMDAVKLSISVGIAGAANTLLVSPVLAVGGSLMLVTLGVFVIGVGVSYGLYLLDDYFKVSETIIKNIKKLLNEKPNPTPYHPDQLFSMWGRLSRG